MQVHTGCVRVNSVKAKQSVSSCSLQLNRCLGATVDIMNPKRGKSRILCNPSQVVAVSVTVSDRT